MVRIQWLLVEGHKDFVLDNCNYTHRYFGRYPANLSRYIAGDRFRIVCGDIRDHNVCLESLDGVVEVLYLAAAEVIRQLMYHPFRYCSDNLGAAAQLFDIVGSEQTSVRMIVVGSSISIYYEERAYKGENYEKVYSISVIESFS